LRHWRPPLVGASAVDVAGESLPFETGAEAYEDATPVASDETTRQPGSQLAARRSKTSRVSVDGEPLDVVLSW
jgi:hypothetical protein